MTANAHERFMAVAVIRNLGVSRIQHQVGRIVLEVFALDDAFHVPSVAFLADGQLVDAAAVQYFLSVSLMYSGTESFRKPWIRALAAFSSRTFIFSDVLASVMALLNSVSLFVVHKPRRNGRSLVDS